MLKNSRPTRWFKIFIAKYVKHNVHREISKNHWVNFQKSAFLLSVRHIPVCMIYHKKLSLERNCETESLFFTAECSQFWSQMFWRKTQICDKKLNTFCSEENSLYPLTYNSIFWAVAVVRRGGRTQRPQDRVGGQKNIDIFSGSFVYLFLPDFMVK